MQKILSLIFHVAFIASAIFSLKFIPAISDRYIGVLEILPFVLSSLSLVLGYRFNRSLVIFSALLFVIIYAYFFFSPGLNNQQQILSLNSLAIFVAVNIALLCFYSERGIFTLIGISRLLFIFIQLGLFIWLIRYQAVEWQKLLSQVIFPALEIKLAFWGQVSLLAVLTSTMIIGSSYLTQEPWQVKSLPCVSKNDVTKVQNRKRKVISVLLPSPLASAMPNVIANTAIPARY